MALVWYSYRSEEDQPTVYYQTGQAKNKISANYDDQVSLNAQSVQIINFVPLVDERYYQSEISRVSIWTDTRIRQYQQRRGIRAEDSI